MFELLLLINVILIAASQTLPKRDNVVPNKKTLPAVANRVSK